MSTFQAWRVHEQDGQYVGDIESLDTGELPEGEVLIRVSHSALNYKDALSASGNKGVTREFPHTPGIDAAGEVVESSLSKPAVGDKVIVTGYDLGMNTDGGFGEYIRVPAAWVVPMPANWDERKAMIYGTAGLTAGLCVDKLLRMGAQPDQGVVAVTGASGAVGSVAVELLSRLGFSVTAISGKSEHAEHLTRLGAAEVVGRDALAAEKKPMLKPRFAHAVDTVGGGPLAELLKQVFPGGSVACCGLVAGPQLETTVLPFILRGINLLGVDSVEIPLASKQAIWSRFASEWTCPETEASAKDLGKADLKGALDAFLTGASSGSLVLDHAL
ncbi:YhdH/YhfP family quinone oxidoreductase [Marinobacter sp. JSM 1782161]|uniref:YhdH/YhfP family quinone oxidoreductase n=1 Tax=Marinobacter sp. JSM 1782161 TaxID=2685906 RepID=UPI0014034968|nr:YhdH/YhfP family quinone oxidoreductase [Marinobacter sp. JSM 1782161]